MAGLGQQRGSHDRSCRCTAHGAESTLLDAGYISVCIRRGKIIVQELCESRGGRPGLSVLTSLLVSVDVKIYCTVLRHWSQLVPNMSHDI